ncbi:hypothetical protein CDL15_Pgr011279 [Punica granatum]|uniref:Protein DEHYDRATION-INDUCED 19 homolog 4-like n=1 Tax=Punica granatum TaxID=22663 RepID=A0A218WGJ6_PUNGR|nr:hypothetical protein CDL15_Pgr011279 [Punica granatum]
MSSSSRRLRSRLDRYGGALDEAGGEEQEPPPVEYTCPYCAEDFDILGLYCHMDEEHPIAVKAGICPVCAKKVGQEIVAHITIQHEHVQRKRRHRKGGFSSTFSALKNEFREGHLQSHHGGSSRTSLPEPDLLLSSFMFNPVPDAPTDAKLGSSEGTTVNVLCEQPSESNAQKSLIPKKDQKGEDQKCEFVQGLMFSLILDDDL